ncbi:bacteriocin immunity protein [Streptococcus jiangjianxini]|uniref:bacteriocin immunity protein n=1 Tax=Streptococcus jiangjianxini TaxID=3161189 RepID=UPI0032EAD6A1
MTNDREQMLIRVYNLILDPSVSQEERDILRAFMSDLERGSDYQVSMMRLAEDLRQLAVKNLKDYKKLSPNVARLYREIAYRGEKYSNIAKGLMSIGLWGLGK